MSPDPRIVAAVADWQSAAERGSPISVDDLCRDYPDIADHLQEAIRQLRPLYGQWATGAESGTAQPPDTARYQFQTIIGRGGMGEVWEGYDRLLDRRVAIEVARNRLGVPPGTPFRQEARLVAGLEHPSIVPVHDLGELQDGQSFFVMRLVEGKTLGELLHARPHPLHHLPHYLHVFEQVCQAVAVAHSRPVPIVHRDLKPSNVMVGPFGDVQVIDWGLAKFLHPKVGGGEQFDVAVGGNEAIGSAPVAMAGLETRTGDVKGTWAFMPPEQARGERGQVDVRADVFGLGGILCIILTGSPPFIAGELGKSGEGDLSEAFERIARSGTDAELIDLARQCLAPDPSHRPPNAGAVAHAVSAFRTGAEERAQEAARKQAAAEARAEAEAARADETTRRTAAEAEAARLDRAARERMVRDQAIASALLEQTEAALRSGNSERAADALNEAGRRIAEGRVDDLGIRLDQCRADHATLRELNRIDDARWMFNDGQLPPVGTVVLWLVTEFRRYGVVPGRTPSQEAAERINSSAIRERLLTSLEVWFVLGGRDPMVREILAAADPDEFRNAARYTSYSRAAGQWEARHRPVPAEQPGWFAVAHGDDRSLDVATRERLLLAFHRVRPDSLPVLMTLAGLAPAGSPAFADRSAGWYRAALAVAPRSSVARNNLGAALKDRGDVGAAIAEFEEAVGLDPGNAHAHSNLGCGLVGRDPKRAVTECREAVRLNPGDAVAHSNLGSCLIADGDQEGALVSFRRAVELDPAYAKAQNNLGSCLHHLGDRAGAIKSYRAAIRLDPGYALAHYNLGVVYHELGEYQEVAVAARKALECEPTNANARGLLESAVQKLPRQHWRITDSAQTRRSEG